MYEPNFHNFMNGNLRHDVVFITVTIELGEIQNDVILMYCFLHWGNHLSKILSYIEPLPEMLKECFSFCQIKHFVFINTTP